ncbi:hypothetical protein HYU91_00315 [Candidatus Collierbacteria bacterium]|nr:hypothetical protein [Candidatus Collierbacteria bacterium]
MTATMKFVSIPVLAALLIAAALPVLLPHVPPSAISLPPAAVTAKEEIGDTFAAVADGRHTDANHNPNRATSLARSNISAILASWVTLAVNGAPDPNRVQCGAVVDSSGRVIRWILWVADGVRASGGFLAVFTPGAQAPWTSSYDTTFENFLKGPNQKRLDQQGLTWSTGVGCPGNIPTLQKASVP